MILQQAFAEGAGAIGKFSGDDLVTFLLPSCRLPWQRPLIATVAEKLTVVFGRPSFERCALGQRKFARNLRSSQQLHACDIGRTLRLFLFYFHPRVPPPPHPTPAP